MAAVSNFDFQLTKRQLPETVSLKRCIFLFESRLLHFRKFLETMETNKSKKQRAQRDLNVIY